jgi:probable F420-dependent oxidoreductase
LRPYEIDGVALRAPRRGYGPSGPLPRGRHRHRSVDLVVRDINYATLDRIETVTVLTGHARFTDSHVLSVETIDGHAITVTAQWIVVATMRVADMATMPRAWIVGEDADMMKVVVDAAGDLRASSIKGMRDAAETVRLTATPLQATDLIWAHAIPPRQAPEHATRGRRQRPSARGMKFGITTFITDEGMGPGALAAAVEERGFYSLMVTEHSHMPVAYTPPYPGAQHPPREFYRTLDPFVALTAAAASTRKLVLTTGVILLPQRDVIYTAKEAASLDLISNGRVVLGVGIGWNRYEMRHHGLDPAIRGAKLDEQVRALKQIWTRDTAEFHGAFVDFDPIFSWPKPVQRPHPPIYIAGSSPAALRRLHSLGDGWLPPAGLDVQEIIDAKERLAQNGRPHMPITIYGAGRDKEVLSRYAQAGVDEVTFAIPTAPLAATLRELDELATLVEALNF